VELPYLLFGARSAGGTLRVGAETLDIGGLSPQRSVRERIALVPADRAVQGLSQSLTLWENIVMLVEGEHYRNGIFRRGELVTLAREAVDRFLIRPPLTHNNVSTFSGGNQQKALLAKCCSPGRGCCCCTSPPRASTSAPGGTSTVSSSRPPPCTTWRCCG
jgi:ABC-type sugar transport system ATPase subunit